MSHCPCLPWTTLLCLFERSLFLFGFHRFGCDAHTLYLLISLSVANFSFYTWEKFDYLPFHLFLLCFLNLTLSPLFSYFKKIQWHRNEMFLYFLIRFWRYFKGLFSFSVICIWKFYWFAFKFTVFFSPKSLKPVISLDLCYMLISYCKF